MSAQEMLLWFRTGTWFVLALALAFTWFRMWRDRRYRDALPVLTKVVPSLWASASIYTIQNALLTSTFSFWRSIEEIPILGLSGREAFSWLTFTAQLPLYGVAGFVVLTILRAKSNVLTDLGERWRS